uniref:SUB1 homolog n=1 Tax=Amphiprion percula TaxID=161767 RepID=A0A3P8RT32_AMPPE
VPPNKNNVSPPRMVSSPSAPNERALKQGLDFPVKKPKSGESSKPAGSSKGSSNGDNMLQIGKMRYVSVRDFKGKMKPGDKDTFLSLAQWNQLKDQISETDDAIKRV